MATTMHLPSLCGSSLLLLLLFVGSAFCANPDLTRNVTEMILSRGYPVENHQVITSDGFILSLQRIPAGRRSSSSSSTSRPSLDHDHDGAAPNTTKPAVYLQHGLLDNSGTWIYQEVVTESLGYILADAGYDVWLNNIRGNTYSDKNTHLSPKDAAFWAWSYDEMARIDLPSIINYILTTTGQKQLSYIGHSQGTTMGFIGFENPQIAARVNIFIALAPVAFLKHCTSKLVQAMAHLDLAEVLFLFGEKQFAPDVAVLQKLLPGTCTVDPTACENILSLVMGSDNANTNKTMLPVFLAHEPSGTSVQNMVHWSQGVNNNAFQAFDYGSSAKNMQHYNSSTPPIYQPGLLTLPVALFSGGQDDLADPTDVQTLKGTLRSVVFSKEVPEYDHMDFVWGTDANVRIYDDVLTLLKKYAN
eukprot:TRINITY_DN2260_c0_g1_i2.p1 TRINITY_DN2260_c0_g1~~TRINITY_DN2260_c0_g1_i2.p1  ORF type:complete len:416 (+),score=92.39 TRINITY_DN2260_c0_g1_i2:32-1279(+)